MYLLFMFNYILLLGGLAVATADNGCPPGTLVQQSLQFEAEDPLEGSSWKLDHFGVDHSHFEKVTDKSFNLHMKCCCGVQGPERYLIHPRAHNAPNPVLPNGVCDYKCAPYHKSLDRSNGAKRRLLGSDSKITIAVVDKNHWHKTDSEWIKLEEEHKRLSKALLDAQRRYTHESKWEIEEQTRKEQDHKKKAEEVEKLEKLLHGKLSGFHEEIKKKEELRKKAAEEAAKARMKGLGKTPGGVTIDISAQLNRLKIMRSKLEEGTKALEREYKAREQSLGGSGAPGDEVCTICKKEDQIFILENEILKDDEKLAKCRSRPNEFEVGCAETIIFEKNRLQQEVNRRRALLVQMIVEYKQDLDAVKTKIYDCRGRRAGCPTKEEQGLLMKQKQIEDILEKMKKRDAQRTILKIYRCLYDNRGIEGSKLHPVDAMFGLPNAHFSRGCPKLKRIATPGDEKYVKGGEKLYQCICADWSKADVMAKKVANTNGKLRAEAQLQEANMVYNEKKKEEAAHEREEIAKDVEKDEIVEALSTGVNLGEGTIDEIAKKARATLKAKLPPAEFRENEKKIVKKAQQLEKTKSKGEKCDRPDCAQFQTAEKMPQEILDKCMANIGSDEIKGNLKKAFDAGTRATGCALLSLASNVVLQEAHKCMCPKSIPAPGR